MVPIRISAGDLEQIEDEEVNENLPQNISIPKQGEILLSHIPLVWMVPEAQRAGLRFDSNKVAEMDFSWIGNKEDFIGSGVPPAPGVPQVQATATEPTQINDKTKQRRDKFRNHLHRAAIESIAHNCLTFGGGLEIGADSAWTFMNICLSVGWTLSLTKPGEVFVFPCPFRGGDRGVRTAPECCGMGEWDVVQETGDPVGECYVRRNIPSDAIGTTEP